MAEIPPSEIYQIKRVRIGLNVILQIVLGLVLFGFVNYLAFNHFRRWDYTRTHQASLSPQTKKVIGQLTAKDKLKIVVLVAPATPIANDLRDLLTELQINAKKQRKKIDIETINPYQDLNRAKELQQKYKFGSAEALVILDYQGRNKFVNVVDMVEFEKSDDVSTVPPMKAFKGEQVITQGMLGVIEPNQSKIYFVEGLGGLDFIGKPYNKTFMTYLERQNLAVAPLNLLNVESIPADAKALVLTAPKYDPTDRALALLKDYWGKKGRFFIILDPNQSTPILRSWLGSLGVTVQDDRVRKTEDLGNGLLGVYKNVIGNFLGKHPVTKEITGVRTSLDGSTQTLRLIPSPAEQIRVTPLLQAEEGYWGETNYAVGEDEPIRFDKGVDHESPLVLAAAVEQGAVTDERVKVDSARLVVLANADFLNDKNLVSQNLDFSIAAMNWLVNRIELIAIPPIEKTNVRLGLGDDQLHKLNLLVLFVIPGSIALLGFAVCWSRRR